VCHTDFAAGVEACVMSSGCTASRASVTGACLGALGTDPGIPADWVKLTAKAEHVSKLVEQLLAIRAELQDAKL